MTIQNFSKKQFFNKDKRRLIFILNIISLAMLDLFALKSKKNKKGA